MAQKCILILVDGMRPDALPACGHPFCQGFLASGAVALRGHSVMPSVTLPCHLSLFLSAPPQRHGTLTNTYVPQVRPIKSLLQVLHDAGRATAMFYGWEELRDIAAPGSLGHSVFLHLGDYPDSDRRLTQQALDWVATAAPDFVFLYLGQTDLAGHDHGWMGPQYLDAVATAWGCIQQVADATRDSYDLIVTADHGGHARCHGEDCPEDMDIPLLLRTHRPLAPGVTDGSLLDIAPTVCRLLEVAAPRDWEGASLV